MDRFVHLHRHDQFSLYDGLGKAEQAAKHTANIGQPALALTNHGSVCGLIQHYNACKEVGIKPILGIEGYFVPSLEKSKDKRKSYHLTLLVKSDKGYKNLMQLVTESNINGFYYKPRFDLKMLEKYHKGLIVLSGCQAGFIAQNLYYDKPEVAKKFAKKMLAIFGDDFYIEVQPHDINGQIEYNRLLIEFAESLKIPIVMTSDAHYVTKDDYETQAMMRQFKTSFGGYYDAYIMTRKEMLETWRKNHDIGNPKEYINNTLEIAEKCNVKLDFGSLMPRIDFGIDSKKYLKHLAIQGLKDKDKWSEKYKHRLKKELDVVFGKGFEDYFLICWDIINWAKNNGVSTDFGRGSVGGSLLAYALGITQVDPLIHNTVFERFLRPDKTTTPDIDMDFDKRYRDKVFAYIEQRFPNRTAPIITYGLYKTKNLINDLARAYNMDQKDKEQMVKQITDICGDDPKEIDFKELYKDKILRKINNKYTNILTHFSKLYGQICYYGKHASGVAICGKPINKYVGLMKSHNTLVTSYNLKEIEKLGILKMDILGLETVSVVSTVEEITGVKFDESMLNDKKVFKAFRKGETDGIFQFEKDGAKELLRRVKPRNFEELVACNALNRPAPLKLGVVDGYIDAKNGNLDKNTLWYKYTKETYGTIIYQEQVMKICRGLANMDWADTDKVMKSLRKSTVEEDDPLFKKFVEGAVKNGIDRNVAEELFDNMTKYLFNKAHATAYSLLSFYTMYLMIYYPLEYIYSLLLTEKQESKIRLYQSLAAGKNILILPPHVNGSAGFSIEEFEGEKVIRAGLSSIKGIGQKVAEEIISRGPYNCVELVEERVPKRFFNSRVRKILEESGALIFDEDELASHIAQYNINLLNQYKKRMMKYE